MTQEFIKKVGQFHDAFGQQRGNVDRQLRYKLFMEELEEYEKASDENDLVEISDATADLLYIILGTADLHGVTVTFKEPSDTHNICGVSLTEEIKLDIEGYVRLANNEKLVTSFVNDITKMVMLLAYLHEIDDILPELFEEVHSSNMSKLDSNGKPIINDGIIRPDLPVGKILKPDTFRKPDIEAILKKHGKI